MNSAMKTNMKTITIHNAWLFSLLFVASLFLSNEISAQRGKQDDEEKPRKPLISEQEYNKLLMWIVDEKYENGRIAGRALRADKGPRTDANSIKKGGYGRCWTLDGSLFLITLTNGITERGEIFFERNRRGGGAHVGIYQRIWGRRW